MPSPMTRVVTFQFCKSTNRPHIRYNCGTEGWRNKEWGSDAGEKAILFSEIGRAEIGLRVVHSSIWVSEHFSFCLRNPPKNFRCKRTSSGGSSRSAQGVCPSVRPSVRGLHHRSRLNRTEIAEFSSRCVSAEGR